MDCALVLSWSPRRVKMHCVCVPSMIALATYIVCTHIVHSQRHLRHLWRIPRSAHPMYTYIGEHATPAHNEYY